MTANARKEIDEIEAEACQARLGRQAQDQGPHQVSRRLIAALFAVLAGQMAVMASWSAGANEAEWEALPPITAEEACP